MLLILYYDVLHVFCASSTHCASACGVIVAICANRILFREVYPTRIFVRAIASWVGGHAVV